MKRILFGLVALAGLTCFAVPAMAAPAPGPAPERFHERVEHREVYRGQPCGKYYRHDEHWKRHVRFEHRR